ncbi:glycosyltransferase [Flavivirga eckloniae]|uniref:glycosyltransferase n=1 Tax=Flavivirga eckloniae TaxID=1803846 RepID=UPI00131556A9|nr:glycosyltransferase [Flavivirga eckloniae]
MKEKPNIAILTPNLNAYSETFIQAHKTLLHGCVKYYYGSANNQHLEGEGLIFKGLGRYIGKAINVIKKQPLRAESKALVKSWKKNKIQVILAEYGTTAAMYIDAIKTSKLPLIIHFHGYDATVTETINSFKPQYLEMFKYAKYIIVVSEVMKKKLIALGCPESKLVKNIYGPNNLFADAKPQFLKPQFIAAGRFTNKKAPYYTILAFNNVLKEFPEAKLLMAGNGNLLETCKNLVNYLKIENSVSFLGVIKPQEFKAYLEESMAFVQHSITASNGDMEGTPLAILESSIAGVPVITSKHAGIPEVIIDGKTGLLFKEHDVDTMTEHMITILQDKNLAISLGQAGKEFIKANFLMDRHINTINGLVQNII